MTVVPFEQQNLVIGENQPQYSPIPAFHNPIEGSLAFCIKLNAEEQKQVQESGTVWMKLYTGGKPFPPIHPSMLKWDVLLGTPKGLTPMQESILIDIMNEETPSVTCNESLKKLVELRLIDFHTVKDRFELTDMGVVLASYVNSKTDKEVSNV